MKKLKNYLNLLFLGTIFSFLVSCTPHDNQTVTPKKVFPETISGKKFFLRGTENLSVPIKYLEIGEFSKSGDATFKIYDVDHFGDGSHMNEYDANCHQSTVGVVKKLSLTSSSGTAELEITNDDEEVGFDYIQRFPNGTASSINEWEIVK